MVVFVVDVRGRPMPRGAADTPRANLTNIALHNVWNVLLICLSYD